MTNAEDDLESLFDEMSTKRTDTEAATATAPSPLVQANEQAAPPVSADGDIQADEQAANGTTSDNPMFDRLGGIVRLFHDSLRELGYDQSLAEVATQITDAQERLEYVATLTEQAANKVLNTIDACIPEQDELEKIAQDMEMRWDLLFNSKMSVEEFKLLAADSREFAKNVAISTEKVKARMLEIMMAQDFQDITGQLIKRIVTITNTAEHELAHLLLDNAPPVMKAAIIAAEPKQSDLMQGPSTPTVALVQDDVDSLLADLGF